MHNKNPCELLRSFPIYILKYHSVAGSLACLVWNVKQKDIVFIWPNVRLYAGFVYIHWTNHLSRQSGAVSLTSPVLQWKAGQLCGVVDPFELQRPAPLGHTGQNQPVALQVELAAHRLRLEVWRHVICKEEENRLKNWVDWSFLPCFFFIKTSSCSIKKIPQKSIQIKNTHSWIPHISMNPEARMCTWKQTKDWQKKMCEHRGGDRERSKFISRQLIFHPDKVGIDGEQTSSCQTTEKHQSESRTELHSALHLSDCNRLWMVRCEDLT